MSKNKITWPADILYQSNDKHYMQAYLQAQKIMWITRQKNYKKPYSKLLPNVYTVLLLLISYKQTQ